MSDNLSQKICPQIWYKCWVMLIYFSLNFFALEFWMISSCSADSNVSISGFIQVRENLENLENLEKGSFFGKVREKVRGNLKNGKSQGKSGKILCFLSELFHKLNISISGIWRVWKMKNEKYFFCFLFLYIIHKMCGDKWSSVSVIFPIQGGTWPGKGYRIQTLVREKGIFFYLKKSGKVRENENENLYEPWISTLNKSSVH